MAHIDSKRSAERKYRDQLRKAARAVKHAPGVDFDLDRIARSLGAEVR